jgi:hypothetical protein
MVIQAPLMNTLLFVVRQSNSHEQHAVFLLSTGTKLRVQQSAIQTCVAFVKDDLPSGK